MSIGKGWSQGFIYEEEQTVSMNYHDVVENDQIVVKERGEYGNQTDYNLIREQAIIDYLKIN